MAFVGASDDFSQEDDAILQESLSRAGLFMDNEGIVRSEEPNMYSHVTHGPWTDSGIGEGKRSSTSTLHHLQTSFEEDFVPLGDESINISELEASQEDLSFDESKNMTSQGGTASPTHLPASQESSTLNKPQHYDLSHNGSYKQKSVGHLSGEFDNHQLFSKEYYQQLHDLGVLVDGVDLSRDSVDELEETNTHMTSQLDDDDDTDMRLRDSQDLIGEYLESELRKEQEEHKTRESVEGGGDNPSRTVNNHNVPEEAGSLAKKSEHFDRQGQPQQPRMGTDDDDDNEFYNKTDHILPASFTESGVGNQPPLQQSIFQGGIVESRTNRFGQDKSPRKSDIKGSGSMASPRSLGHRKTDDDVRSVHSDSAAAHSRPSSVTGRTSAASDGQKEAAAGRLTKTRSQESFFKVGSLPHSGERTKRLLPKPSNSEPNQSFRLKSSVSAGSKSGPVKPTRASGFKVTELSDAEDSITGDEILYIDKSAQELSSRLTQEAQKRKQATELVQQLQTDYGNLLTKYALAELTIDQMRLGAKITLHADSPTPGQAQSGVISPAVSQHAQVMPVGQSPSQGVLIMSSLQDMHDQVSPDTDDFGSSDGRHLPVTGVHKSKSLSDLHRGSISSLRQSVLGSDDGLQDLSATGIQVVRADLMAEAKSMKERLESFSVLLDGGQLTLEDQVSMFDQIKDDHDQLRRAYLKVKGDYNVLRRSGTLTMDSQNFDDNKELEGQLFRLGMRFEDVQERVEANQTERSKYRQPFHESNHGSNHNNTQATDKKETNSGSDLSAGHEVNGAVVGKHHVHNEEQARDSSEELVVGQRIYQLREEYNANMDAYRKLKYLSNTPDGERQIERVVVQLSEICAEMPDMFRLSPEIQDRQDKMQRENRLKMNERKSSVWEKLNKREQEMKQHRRSPTSQLLVGGHSSVLHRQLEEGTPIILRQRSDNSDLDSLHARRDGSTRSSLGSILPDRMDRPPSRTNSLADSSPSYSTSGRPSSRNSNRGYSSVDPERPSSRSGTPGADHSFSDSSTYRGHDSSSQILPRPRRHEHGMKDPMLSQVPDLRSVRAPSPGPSSGQAHGGRGKGQHQDSAGGAAGIEESGEGLRGALAALPGPGKLKQLSKLRAADDADSGFVGSTVDSGAGAVPAERPQQQQQVALRLTAAADDSISSTLTDQSEDTSELRDKMSVSQRLKVKADKVENQRTRIQQAAGDSSDNRAERETAETGSDASFGAGEQGKHKSKSSATEEEDEREESYDATLEENSSGEFDISTPRADSQSESIINERQGSGQESANQKTTVAANPKVLPKSQKLPSQTQTTNETQDDTDKASWDRSEDWHGSDVDNSVDQKSLTSPPPVARPPSRGSPAAGLHQTHERRSQSRPSKRAQASQRRQEGYRTDTTELKLTEHQSGPQLEHLSSHLRRHTNLNSSHQPGVLHDPENSGIAGRTKELEERSVGSEVEVGSAVTRSSSVASSNKLKALQEEIERLKEGVARANERPSHLPPPAQIYHLPTAPAASPGQPQEPEYYDPFDDPYGFMRMPRRRANSFSGGRERVWDEWYWTLPQNRQYDGGDIPLGYAAADAYADHPLSGSTPGQRRNMRENVKNRLRQRRMEDRQRKDLQPDSVSETANQQQAGAAGVPDEQTAAMYDYYLPSRDSAQNLRQRSASQGYQAVPGGAKVHTSTNANHGQPWYQIRRLPRPSTSQNFHAGTQSHARESQASQNQLYNLYNKLHASPGVGVTQRTATQLCPTCGGSVFHTHDDHIHMDQLHPNYPPPQYSHISARRLSPAPGSRQRSRSASRTGHAAPLHSQHRVRDYVYMTDSDEEETVSRSRSLSRGLPRAGSHHRSQVARSRQRSDSMSDLSGDEDISLDQSLSLSVDIGRLTKKILGTVTCELQRSKNRAEFGSSYW